MGVAVHLPEAVEAEGADLAVVAAEGRRGVCAAKELAWRLGAALAE